MAANSGVRADKQSQLKEVDPVDELWAGLHGVGSGIALAAFVQAAPPSGGGAARVATDLCCRVSCAGRMRAMFDAIRSPETTDSRARSTAHHVISLVLIILAGKYERRRSLIFAVLDPAPRHRRSPGRTILRS